MLKRRYGDRAGWRRVLERKYAQDFLDTKEFQGYITLLKIEKITEPLLIQYDDIKVCIVDEVFFWLQQYPKDRHHAVTTMFNEKGEVVQWYVDICLRNGISDDQIPWFDDLFLDIIKLPTGEVIQKDADELEQALLSGEIDQSQYNLAWIEATQITRQIKSNQFSLIHLSDLHKNLLLDKLS